VLGVELFVRLIGIGAAKADVEDSICGHGFFSRKESKVKT
jgi:hypothetical protein